MKGYDENTDAYARKNLLFPQTAIMTDQFTAESAEISSQLSRDKKTWKSSCVEHLQTDLQSQVESQIDTLMSKRKNDEFSQLQNLSFVFLMKICERNPFDGISIKAIARKGFIHCFSGF